METIHATSTGSLDIQPEFAGLKPHEAHLFMDPASGHRHLALSLDQADGAFISMRRESAFVVKSLFPADLDFEQRQLGDFRTEIRVPSGVAFVFFELDPIIETSPAESIQIVTDRFIDPYELVVKNQVFKDTELKHFESLEVEEEVTYRYQGPSGAGVDVTFVDTVIQRRDLPTERIRKEMFIGGVRWKHEMELPLIQPEKVQSEPLVIDLDKSYSYSYLGEDDIDGHRTWKVGFKPKQKGDFYSGTVWIDQSNGAHRKVQAVQSGLEPPVIGHEIQAFYDWVTDGDQRYWTQVREQNLMVLNLIGETIPIQLDTRRYDFKFNRAQTAEVLAAAYASDVQILRDTPEGYKYLAKKGDERELVDQPFAKQKFLLGGVLMDPDLDYPIPLAGFNYLNLDFLGQGYQFNALIAGALNVVHFTNNDVFDKGWDLTAELFATALYFGDEVYINGEVQNQLEVESLREAVNVTLGIPLNNFFKLSTNYSLRYLDYRAADDTSPDFVLPSSTFEHIGRMDLRFSRGRFVSALGFEAVKRTKWEAWGLPEETQPLFDQYQTVQFDASYTKRLKRFQTVTGDFRYIKGWDLDRFSSIGFGAFENTVSGFGTTGIQADEAIRLRFEYEFGIAEIMQLDLSLDGARAWDALNQNEPVDLVGVGIAANFVGPWKMLVRANVGYGIHATLDGEEGDFSGQIYLLRIY